MELYGALLLLAAVAVSVAYHYDTLWHDHMPLDHFGFSTNASFRLRYLKNDTHWRKGGPIFFYCGNEGDIVLFAENTGFMWEHAKDFKAMVVFAEHRFYGQTMPFGNRSFESPQHLGYLSSEQALADFVVLIRHIKSTVDGAENSPVIAFGGSYGAMLAAWMRQKYPNTVIGAFASSAPVLHFMGVTPCNEFANIITRTYANSGTNCEKRIRKFHEVIAEKIKTNEGRTFLTNTLALCPDSHLTSASNLTELNAFLTNSWAYLAMIDYPYATDFVANVPAWPVEEVCKHLKNDPADDETLIQNAAMGLSVYTNYSGTTPCNTFSQDASPSLGFEFWKFQTCTEMTMPMCNTEKDMFFPKLKWDLPEFSDKCFKEFGVRPREHWAITNYGGLDLRGASNIIHSNGHLDPWTAGGFFPGRPGIKLSPTIILLYIEDGAHHVDLRESHPNDTQSTIDARNSALAVLRCWVKHPGETCCNVKGECVKPTTPTGGSNVLQPLSLFIVAIAVFSCY